MQRLASLGRTWRWICTTAALASAKSRYTPTPAMTVSPIAAPAATRGRRTGLLQKPRQNITAGAPPHPRVLLGSIGVRIVDLVFLVCPSQQRTVCV